MARLEQLRWVPMLIRAYYDAQLRVASAKGNNTKIDARSVSLSNKRPPQMAGKLRGSKKTAPRQQPKRQNLTTKVTEGQNDLSTRLLRELRVTNRKLKGLDEVRQQLKSLGLSLDEFNRRFDELNNASSTNQGRPGDHSTRTPAAPETSRNHPNMAPWPAYPQPFTDQKAADPNTQTQTRL